MRHLDVAICGVAAALLLGLMLAAPFGITPKCFQTTSSPTFCKVTHAR